MVAQFHDRKTDHRQSRDGPNPENALNSYTPTSALTSTFYMLELAQIRTSALYPRPKLSLTRTPDRIRHTRRDPDSNRPTMRAFLKTYSNGHLLHAWSCWRTVVHWVRSNSVIGMVHFWYISFSVQWRSFWLHQHFAMTISGNHNEQFRYIKMSISVHVHFGTYLFQNVIFNASIYFIELLGHCVIRMLTLQFNHLATSSLLQKIAKLCCC